MFSRIAALLLAAVRPAAAQLPPPPAWEVPGAARRGVFRAGALPGRCVLVDLPAEPDDTAFAARADGGYVPAQRVHHADGRAAVLVQRRDGADEYAVYFGGAPPEPGPPPRDPAPLAVTWRANRSRAVPNTWARLAFMLDRAGSPVAETLHGDFGTLRPSGSDRRRRGRGGAWLLHARTVLMCPDDGLYRFAVDAVNAAFVVLDGQDVVAAWPGVHPAGSWRHGTPLFLRAGPHRMEVFHAAPSNPQVRVGWTPPGASETVPLPASQLLCADRAGDVRVERRDRTLHPDFDGELGTAYAFRGVDGLFVPLRLRQRAANWMTDDMSFSWRVDGTSARGPAPEVYLHRAARVAVELGVRDALGFAASVSRTVDARRVPVKHFGLAAAVESLPAVCFPADRVDPFLEVRTDAPPGTDFELFWTRIRADGREAPAWRPFAAGGAPVRVPLGPGEAGSLHGLRWELRHLRRTVLAGRVEFTAPPFRVLPVEARGQGLYDGAGNRLVLVPLRERGPAAPAPLPAEVVFGHIACYDDFLARPDPRGPAAGETYDRVLARILDGPDRPLVTRAAPPSGDAFRGAAAPLLALAHAAERVGAPRDVTVLSVARGALLARMHPAEFERHAGALADLLGVSTGGAVLWVTPPPFPGLGPRVRDFALAIRRAADARGQPVADLFSAFSGLAPGAPPPLDAGAGTLTPAGHELAAQLIARALLAATREPAP